MKTLLLVVLLTTNVFAATPTLESGYGSEVPGHYTPTKDVLFDQSLTSHDSTTSSEYIAAYNLDSRSADDFEFATGTWSLENTYWWIGYWNGSYLSPDSFTVYIYEDDGGQPTNPVTGGEWESFVATSWGEAADDPSQRYTFDVDVTFSDIPGDTVYWVVPQPEHQFPPQMGPAVANGVVWGEAGYFGSDYFGYPNWVPGSAVFGYDFSSHFVLNGTEVTGIESASFGEVKALFK